MTGVTAYGKTETLVGALFETTSERIFVSLSSVAPRLIVNSFVSARSCIGYGQARQLGRLSRAQQRLAARCCSNLYKSANQ